MKKIKVVALVGESCSGKTTLFKELSSMNVFHSIITSTTRPKRENERDGIDYHFVTQESYEKNLREGKIIAPRTFKESWHYGVYVSNFRKDKINLIVLDPPGLRSLKNDNRFEVYSFYINVPREQRLIRALERGDKTSEILRRLKADDKDFKNIYSLVDEEIRGVYSADSLRGIVLYGARKL